MKSFHVILSFVVCLFLAACDSSKDKIKRNIEEMSSTPISVPLDEMKCLTHDSIQDRAPWKYAKLKLVHYIDSVTCTSCYLTKIMSVKNLFQKEKESNYKFYNIFIVDPRSNKRSLLKLKDQYDNNVIPSTIFIDTAHVFIDANSKIPKETMYHTFLLDENNNVIFVGDPLALEDKYFRIIDEKLLQIK